MERGVERFHRRPFVRRTLYIGYGARLVLSMLFPLGLGGGFGPATLFLWPDIWPGFLSYTIVQNVLRLNPETFEGTLATTIVQGTLLTNRPVRDGHFRLEDLTVEILHQYGIEKPGEMQGLLVLE